MLTARTEEPQKRLRIVYGLLWGTPDLEKSECKRTLNANGLLTEMVGMHGDPDGLADGELDRWITSFPVEELSFAG